MAASHALCLGVGFYICLPARPLACLSLFVSVCLSVSVSVSLSVCLSVCVSLSVYLEENSNTNEPIVHSHSQKFPRDTEDGGWTIPEEGHRPKCCVFSKIFQNSWHQHSPAPIFYVCLFVCLPVFLSVCLFVSPISLLPSIPLLL